MILCFKTTTTTTTATTASTTSVTHCLALDEQTIPGGGVTVGALGFVLFASCTG